MRLDPAEQDFGTVLAGDSVEVTVSLHNDGDRPLHVRKFRPDCGCLTVTGPERVAPGGAGEMVVRFDSSRFRGQVVKSVMVESDDRRRSLQQYRLVGTVTPLVETEPRDLHMIALPGERPQLDARVLATGERRIQLHDVSSRHGAVSVRWDETKPGREFSIHLEAPPSPRPIDIPDLLELRLTTPDGRERDAQLSVRVEHRTPWGVPSKFLVFGRAETAGLAEAGAKPLRKSVPVRALLPEFTFHLTGARVEKGPPGLFRCGIEVVEAGREYLVWVALTARPKARNVTARLVIESDYEPGPRQIVHIRGRF